MVVSAVGKGLDHLLYAVLGFLQLLAEDGETVGCGLPVHVAGRAELVRSVGAAARWVAVELPHDRRDPRCLPVPTVGVVEGVEPPPAARVAGDLP